MVAAPAVRSVAPRLRDPCASVRPSGRRLMVCVGSNFLRFAGWKRVAFFGLGRVWEVLYDVFLRVLRGSRFANPAPSSPRYRRLGILACPYGVQKQSCWLSACERSAFVPESAVCNKRGSRRACRRYNHPCRQPAQFALERTLPPLEGPHAHHFVFRRPRLQTTTWVDLLVKAEARAAAAAAASAAAETAAGAAGAAAAGAAVAAMIRYASA